MRRWQRTTAVVLAGVLGVASAAGAHATVQRGSPGTRSAAAGTEPERLDRFVVEQMRRADVPGVAYAVVTADGTDHHATFGDDGDGRPVTRSTPFLWGSVAKPVTASVVVLLAGTGDIDLDAPVTAYLPEFSMADAEAEEITVRHLLAQTGGIPPRMDLTDRAEPNRRPGDVVDDLADASLEAGVGERHIYSSVNYMLLGAIIEAVTGKDLAVVLRERLFGPAGMESMITDQGTAAERLPPGHRYVLGRARPFRTSFDPAGVGYGYVAGSLDDAAAFARALLGAGDVLSDEQRRTLAAEQVSTGEDRSYGLGLRTWPVFGGDAPMVWHGGAAPGYQAAVVLLPEQQLAVVVLQNAYGPFQEPALLDTAWGLASMLSGTDPELHEVDPAYGWLLGALGAVCLGLLVVLVSTLHRARRAIAPRSSRRAAAVLGGWLLGLVTLGGALLAIPGYFGVGLGQVVLWAPDLAVLLYAGLALAVAVAVTRVLVAVGQTRRSTAAPRGSRLPIPSSR